MGNPDVKNEPIIVVMEKATAVSLYGYLTHQEGLSQDVANDAADSIAQAIGHPVPAPESL